MRRKSRGHESGAVSSPAAGPWVIRAESPPPGGGIAGTEAAKAPTYRGEIGAGSSARPWPGWVRVSISLVLLFHMAAVVAGALGVPPSSLLERRVADLFTRYHDLVDQGYAYRYYAEPPPTPVITAQLHFGDGRAAEDIRLPGRPLAGPRLRHQRQLALANALFADFQDAKRGSGDGSRSRLARAYARHLGFATPGCTSVTLHAQQHLIPDPEHVRRALATSGAAGFDLFDEDLFTTPEWIGDFACDGS
jgi:hypothetical protein